ncbi:MAG: CPBP family intramembrane glutamic endopeptidase [Kofleriaceae bacterium]
MATLIVTQDLAAMVGAPIEVSIGLGQLGLLAIPVAVVLGRHLPLDMLGLRRTDLRYFGAAVLIGVSAWYLNMHLAGLLALPEGEVDRFARQLEEPALPVALLTIALAPAICEEIVFRGVLTRGLATRFQPWAAVAIGATLFSLYHKPIQMPATLTLGLVFGALTLRARSVVPSMLAHFLNNTIALVVSRGDVPEVAGWLARNPVPAMIGSGVATAAGIVLFALPDRGRP